MRRGKSCIEAGLARSTTIPRKRARGLKKSSPPFAPAINLHADAHLRFSEVLLLRRIAFLLSEQTFDGADRCGSRRRGRADGVFGHIPYHPADVWKEDWICSRSLDHKRDSTLGTSAKRRGA